MKSFCNLVKPKSDKLASFREQRTTIQILQYRQTDKINLFGVFPFNIYRSDDRAFK